MIVARGGGKDATDVVLMILEPGNIAKIQIGQPIIKSLNEFVPELPIKVDLMLAWVPDAAYVVEQVKAGRGFAEVLKDAMARAEVFNRPGHDPEALTKVPL